MSDRTRAALAICIMTAAAMLIPVSDRCTYCDVKLDVNIPLGSYLWNGWGQHCHRECFWKAHPIPPRPGTQPQRKFP